MILKVNPDGISNIVAGNKSVAPSEPPSGYTGDGPGPAISLGAITALAVDNHDNLYIAELGRIRKLTTDGLVTTVAGTGNTGYSGDGQAATKAQIYDPSGLAIDSSGNLFITDFGNLRIRKVSNGVITTIAGNGKGPQSDDDGPAAKAQLLDPHGLALDAQGALYFADSATIRKIASDGTISTIAGNGQVGYSGDGGPSALAELDFPRAVAVDGAGNVLVADQGSGRIRRIAPAGTIDSIAGTGPIFLGGSLPAIEDTAYFGDGGPAATAGIGQPSSIAVDSKGDIHVADPANLAVRVLRPSSQTIIISAVDDAASETASPTSPGKIVVIYGTGLGPANLVVNTTSPVLSTTAGGTRVTFNGIPAPVIYSSANQVSAIVPYEISGSIATVVIAYQGQNSDPFTVPLAPAAPSLFTLSGTGAGDAAAINASTGVIVDALHPAHAGDYISFFATGEGQTTPSGIDGAVAAAPAYPKPSLKVSATVGGLSAVVQYAGAAPSEIAGLMQVNVQIPAGVAPGGYVLVVLQVGEFSSAPRSVWIAVAGS